MSTHYLYILHCGILKNRVATNFQLHGADGIGINEQFVFYIVNIGLGSTHLCCLLVPACIEHCSDVLLLKKLGR